MAEIRITIPDSDAETARSDIARLLDKAPYSANMQAVEPQGETPGITLVRAYLAAMESRNLETAAGYLAAGFRMTFPGGTIFSTPQELAEWGRTRYRFVRKSYEGFDDFPGANARIVYCYGTLNGEWPDGTAFSGIRFIDRFRITAGKLADQRVWNDLAEYRAQNPTS